MSCERFADQRGESLLESLLAIMILSVVVASSFGGLQLAMRSSTLQREHAVAGELLRNSAEVLSDPDREYIDLAGCEEEDTYEDLPREPGYSEVGVRVEFLEVSSAEGPVTARSLGSGTVDSAAKDKEEKDKEEKDKEEKDKEEKDKGEKDKDKEDRDKDKDDKDKDDKDRDDEDKDNKKREESSPGSCPDEDPGLQKITLTVTTPAGGSQSLTILKARR